MFKHNPDSPLKIRPVLALLATLALAACAGNYQYHDREAQLQRDDYRQALSARPAPTPAEAPPIPQMQDVMATPSAQTESKPLVSLAVDQSVPVRDVLFELSRQAGFDLELDPRITGSIILSVKQRPVDEVIQRICDMSGLRYKFENNILRVEIDEPYHKTYKLDYVSLIRKSESGVSTSVDLVASGSGGGGGGGGGGNSSSSSVSGESTTDFWAEMEANLAQILSNSGTAPTLSVASATTAGTEGGAPASATPAASAPPAPAPASGGTGATQQSFFTSNKQAGIISVFATERQHKLVEEYLKKLKDAVTAQVLIEARVLEVSLDNEFSGGINWQLLFNNSLHFLAPNYADNVSVPYFQASFGPHDFTAIARLLEKFGTIRTLSSPRLTVMQNQTAVLKVAENQVFFQVTVDRQTDTTTNTTTVTATSQTKTVPVGVIITVQPSINLDTDEVSMALRPTVTRVTGQVTDPAVDLQTQGMDPKPQSVIPIISVQELDSMVSMHSGETLVMGGLMQDSGSSTDKGIPGLSEIPVAGYAFKEKDDSYKKTELVIFLKATIVRGAGATVNPTDTDLYHTFGQDRRPLGI